MTPATNPQLHARQERTERAVRTCASAAQGATGNHAAAAQSNHLS
jgi:hypothetical protein